MIPYYILPSFNIGPLTLHTWGLFAGIAFALALFFALNEAKRKNISEESIFDLAILILLGGVVGARGAYVLENWDYYSQNPAKILIFEEGGLMFFGGALLAIFLAGVYIKRKKLDFWNIVDSLALSFAIGEFIGRIGCTLADLHIGTRTSLPWAQEYIDGTARHPISIYMSLNGLAMLVVLWVLRKKVKAKGALFLIFVLWYSGTRFFLDLLRCNDLEVCDPRYWGYTPSQYVSLGAFIISSIYLSNIFKNPSAGGKNHMAEQQNGNAASKDENANENKNLQSSVVSYTEIEEVVFDSNAAVAGNTGAKDKIKDIVKKPWAHLIAIILVLALGAAGASVYYTKMYYGKMFEKSPFSFQGKTWVSYDDPIVKLTIVNDPKCTSCNSEPVVGFLKSGLASTFDIEEINFDSQAGKDMVNKFNIKSVPAFIFSPAVKDLKKLKGATPEELEQTFTVKDDQYYLKSAIVNSMAAEMGIELGRFISVPEITAEDRIKGPDSAPITIIEFSDFKCPYCKQESGIINQVFAAYPGKVRLVFKHLPLPTHPEAQFAAEAAECAGEQGKFFEIADVFFAKQDKLDPASITGYAWGLKLDVKKFKACTDSGKFKAKIANDSQAAAEFGVRGTPALFIGDKLYGGGMSLDQFKEVIDAKLAE